MDWIDFKYINGLSSYVRNFKKINTNLWNFSCPICNDSKKNKLAARGYIYPKEGKFRFHCHNCGFDSTFKYFLKTLNPSIYAEYLLESLSCNHKIVEDIKPNYAGSKPIFMNRYDLPLISELEEGHQALTYIQARKIPEQYYSLLLYAENFASFVENVIPKRHNKMSTDKRIIIPFLNKKKEMIAFQGRAIESCDPKYKYITCKVVEDASKIFGLDKINSKKTIFILEGPIDSMFIENSLALAGSDVAENLFKNCNKEKLIFVFDNEPRNKEIINKMSKWINRGYRVSIWGNRVLSEKDINDLILSGLSSEEITKQILDNTYKGMIANLKLNEWKRI